MYFCDEMKLFKLIDFLRFILLLFSLCPHAASSGFLASPNPVAAMSATRAAGKGTTLGGQYFFPQLCNLACRYLIGWGDTTSWRECIHQTTLNCNVTPNISSILQRLFHGGRTEAARQHAFAPCLFQWVETHTLVPAQQLCSFCSFSISSAQLLVYQGPQPNSYQCTKVLGLTATGVSRSSAQQLPVYQSPWSNIKVIRLSCWCTKVISLPATGVPRSSSLLTLVYQGPQLPNTSVPRSSAQYLLVCQSSTTWPEYHPQF